MRCQCCNRILTDYETTLRHKYTKEFVDICLKCLDGLGIKTKGRKDLLHQAYVPEDIDVFSELLLDERSLYDELPTDE